MLYHRTNKYDDALLVCDKLIQLDTDDYNSIKLKSNRIICIIV